MHEFMLLLFSAAMSVALPASQSQYGQYGVITAKTLNLENLNTGLTNSKAIDAYPDFRPHGREEAVLEQEYWLSRKDSIYENAQKVAARVLMPKPIVDTIQEHEKYGNDGEAHRIVASAIINGFSAIGNVGNTIVDLPFKAKDRIAKTVTAALNVVGGKVSGLY